MTRGHLRDTWTLALAAAGLLSASQAALACHVIVDAGGPYVAECSGGPVTIRLDGSRTNACGRDPLFYVWSSDCPGASMDDVLSVTPVMTMDGPAPCQIDCEVLLTVFDRFGASDEDQAPVTVADTLAPEVTAWLAPLTPLAPAAASSPSSVCSAPASRAFRVACAAVDLCDPAPTLEPRLIVTARTAGGSTEELDLPVACGDAVVVELEPAAAHPRHARSPRPAVSVRSDGTLQVTGLAVTLVASAEDRCGNASVAAYDPAVDPAVPCEAERSDGTCCPPLAPPRR